MMHPNKMSSSSRSASMSKRDEMGRFASSSPSNIKRKKRAAQKRKHKEKRKEITDNFFNEYLQSFVRCSKRNDYVIALRWKGMFCELYESIVKTEYRLGPNLRYARLKAVYSKSAHLRSATHVPKLNVKPKKYFGCRLPDVAFSSEMKAVRNWITMLEENNVLLLPSVDEAVRFCKDILRNASVTDHKIRLPLQSLPGNKSQTRNNIRDGRPSASASAATSDIRETKTPSAGNETRTSAIAQNESSEDLNHSSHHNENGLFGLMVCSPKASELSQSAQEDVKKSKRLKVCLEIARHEQMYTLLHLAVDNNLESRFGVFSGTYLKDVAEQGEEPCELVKEILTYAHWKRYGVPNQFAFDRLETRLKNTADLADRVRLLTSTEKNPLALFKDMRWDFMKEH